jgi:hypothetical protein
VSGPGSGTFGAVDHAAVPSVVAFEVADPAFAAGSPFHGSAEPSLSFGVQAQGKVRNNRLQSVPTPVPASVSAPPSRTASRTPGLLAALSRSRDGTPWSSGVVRRRTPLGRRSAALQQQPAELGTVPVPVGGSWSAAGGPISSAGRPAMPRAALSRRPAWVAALPRPPGVDRRVRVFCDWTLTP